MNKKPTAEEALDEKYCGHPDKIRVYDRITILKAMEAHANNAVEEHKLRLRDKINKRVEFLTAEGGSSQLDRASGLIECLEFLNNKD